MSEKRKIEAYIIERSDKVVIIIDDKDLVEYVYDWADDCEVEFDTDNHEKPLLTIKLDETCF